MALLEYPELNSSYNPDTPFEYKTYTSHNISVAIDGPKGLVVPNIKNVQDLSMVEIQEELNRLRDSAMAGRVEGKDLFDGTITISNVGSIGGLFGIPLILPPQVCIIGIGAMKERVGYANIDGKKEIVPQKILTNCISGDHRVLDGGTVARFGKKWKSFLEDPSSLLINLK